MSRLLWDLERHRWAGGVERTTQGQVRADQAVERVKELERRVDKLTLISMALWSLLREKAGLTDEELMARVEQIDLEDGALDGKASAPIVACTGCGRNLSPRHQKCLYCGAPREAQSAFDKVR